MSVRTIKAITMSEGITKSGPRKGQQWKNYMVEFTGGDPDKASTFNAAILGIKVGETQDFTFEKKGDYWNIVEWMPTDQAPSGEPAPSPSTGQTTKADVPAEVWDGKDRATYMESAYKSAARLFEGLGLDKAARLEFLRLARWIYRDIRSARENIPLTELPKEAADVAAG